MPPSNMTETIRKFYCSINNKNGSHQLCICRPNRSVGLFIFKLLAHCPIWSLCRLGKLHSRLKCGETQPKVTEQDVGRFCPRPQVPHPPTPTPRPYTSFPLPLSAPPSLSFPSASSCPYESRPNQQLHPHHRPFQLASALPSGLVSISLSLVLLDAHPRPFVFPRSPIQPLLPIPIRKSPLLKVTENKSQQRAVSCLHLRFSQGHFPTLPACPPFPDKSLPTPLKASPRALALSAHRHHQ